MEFNSGFKGLTSAFTLVCNLQFQHCDDDSPLFNPTLNQLNPTDVTLSLNLTSNVLLLPKNSLVWRQAYIGG